MRFDALINQNISYLCLYNVVCFSPKWPFLSQKKTSGHLHDQAQTIEDGKVQRTGCQGNEDMEVYGNYDPLGWWEGKQW